MNKKFQIVAVSFSLLLVYAEAAQTLKTSNECIGTKTGTTTVSTWGIGDSTYGYAAAITSNELIAMADGSSACTHLFIHDFMVLRK